MKVINQKRIEKRKQTQIESERRTLAKKGKIKVELLTPEERERFNQVSTGLTREWDYISYNEFIHEMNKKYGED